jgi:ATP-dependent Lhr-like helicase
LHDALLTLYAIPPQQEWAEMFTPLADTRRATLLVVEKASFWVAAERLSTMLRLFPNGVIDPVIQSFETTAPEDREEAATVVVRGWMESIGPVTAANLSQRLGLSRELVDVALGTTRSRWRNTSGSIHDSSQYGNRMV